MIPCTLTGFARRLVLGAEFPDTLASAKNLASALNAQREFLEAARMLRETLEVPRKEHVASKLAASAVKWWRDRRYGTTLIVAVLVGGAVIWWRSRRA